MKVKLKTEEQLKKEFGFKDYVDMNGRFMNSLKAEYNQYKWYILNDEKKYLGTIVEVEEYEGNLYTHIHEIDGLVLGLHELWFEHGEFIDESEFKI